MTHAMMTRSKSRAEHKQNLKMTAIYVLEDGETWTTMPPVRLLLDTDEFEDVCNDLKPRALENYYKRLGGDDDLAGITRRQLTWLLELVPEDSLRLAQKIIDEPGGLECDKCHNKLHGGDNNMMGKEHGDYISLCDVCYDEEDNDT